MKKSVWIILFVLLAFAALPALAVTDGELLSVEIVESAMPDALPAAGISGAVVGNAAEPTGEGLRGGDCQAAGQVNSEP